MKAYRILNKITSYKNLFLKQKFLLTNKCKFTSNSLNINKNIESITDNKIIFNKELFNKELFENLIENFNLKQNTEIIIDENTIFDKELLENLIKNNEFDLLTEYNRKFKKEDIYYAIETCELPIKTILYLYNEHDKEIVVNKYNEYTKKNKIYEDLIYVIDNNTRKKLIDELIKLNNNPQSYVYINDYNYDLKNYNYGIANVNKEIKEYTVNKLIENINKISDKQFNIFSFEYYELTGKQFNKLTRKKSFL